MKHLLSLSALTVLPCSPLEQIDAVSAIGCDAASIRVFPVMETDIDVMGSESLQRQILDKVHGSQCEIFDIEVVRVTSDTDVASLQRTMEFGAAIGARRLAVTSGTIQEFEADGESAVLSKLEELSVACERHNLGVMLEFIPYRGIATFRQAVDMVERIGHPGLGVTVDALHFFRSGGTLAELHDVDPKLLACAQLCDAPADAPADLPYEARYGRLLPGKGGFPLKQFVAALPDGLPVCVEVPIRNDQGLNVQERARIAITEARAVLSA